MTTSMAKSTAITFSVVCCLALGPNSFAKRSSPVAVTNGGYMQTQIASGEAIALPLKHTDVKAEIAGTVASVRVIQVFTNPSDKPIEAVYVFPLPHRAAIYSMDIRVGKRVIRGIVKKRAEARQIYNQAKAAGKTAALLEQERPNIFTQSIANIMPGDRIEVKLRYVEDLIPTKGEYEFAFPMVVGPRYVGGGTPTGTRSGTGWGKDTTRIPDASRITPPLLKNGMRPGNDVAVRVHINPGVALHNLRVVTHKASMKHYATGAFIQLDKRDAIPNKDFVLRYRLAGAQPEVAVLTQRDKRGGHFLLMIQPKAQMKRSDIAPLEYVFVVDNSGSMSGLPIQHARAVAERCLNNLRPSDTFQIIKFAGSPDQFAPGAVKASRKNVKSGAEYISNMRGGGGTEFLPALKMALGARKDPSRARVVVFMTDGYVGYERAILRFIKDNANDINVFSLGVGSSVNRSLIDGMARVGGGDAFYLLNNEQPKEIVARVFDTISKPALTNIEIDWGNLDVEEITPAALPDLFGERPVVVAGRFGDGGAGTVTVSGRLAGKRFRRHVQVDLPQTTKNKNVAVAYLWARRRIAEWMDVLAIEPQRSADVETNVTRIALAYNLMSRYTSFVAVDQHIRNKSGAQQTVNVPVPLPQGVSEAAAPPVAYSPIATGGLGGLQGKGSRSFYAPRRRMMKIRSRMHAPSLKADDDKAEREPQSQPKVKQSAVVLRPDIRTVGISSTVDQRKSRAMLKTEVRRIVQTLRRLAGNKHGRITVRLKIGNGGRVHRVAIVTDTMLVPRLKTYLQAKAQRWNFPLQTANGTIVFTLTF